MSQRKRKGDAAENARQKYWEKRGGKVFPISPNYPGVDLVMFLPGRIVLSEEKGQKRNLTAREKQEAIDKLVDAGRDVEFRMRICKVDVELELVHIRKGVHETLWCLPVGAPRKALWPG